MRASTRTKNQSDAEVTLARWLLNRHDAARTNSQPPTLHPLKERQSTLTIREAWQVYFDHYVLKKVKAIETVKYGWKNLEPYFGDRLCVSLTQAVVEMYVSKRRRGIIGRKSRPTTARRELIYLFAALRYCASNRQKLLSPKDLPVLDPPPQAEPRDRWLETVELQALLEAAQQRRRGPRLSRGERFLWLALETGARKGAILGLTWDRVDFEIGMIHFKEPGATTTKKRRGSVPISSTLRPILEQAFRERTSKFVMDNKAEVWRIVRDIARAARVPGVHPHVLRHTAATHMARRGVPLWMIAGVLGNSVTMVERVYGHHCPSALRDAVEKISGGMLDGWQKD